MSYVPSKEDDFVNWSANLIAVSKANAAEWDPPADQLADLEAMSREFAAHQEDGTVKKGKCTEIFSAIIPRSAG